MQNFEMETELNISIYIHDQLEQSKVHDYHTQQTQIKNKIMRKVKNLSIFVSLLK